MSLFHFFGFTVFKASFWIVKCCLTGLQFVFSMFLRFFKEPAQIACVFFEAFSGGFILLELEMISFPRIIFKLFFRARFAHYLTMFSQVFFIYKILG